jgi:hypothetical protein
MAQLITLNNIDTTAITAISGPRISGIQYPGDDTAASIDGGQTISLTGTGFQTGLVVYVNGVAVAAASVISVTLVTFVAPAQAAGSYTLHVVNTDGGTATFVPGIQYSGVPAWSTTAGSLGTAESGTAFSSNLAATSDSTVTYSIASGALPDGVTLDSVSGAVSGTVPTVASATTYNFTVRATDGENQDTDRAFSITVNSGLLPGQVAYTTPGTYSWTVPAGVTSVSVVAVGGGGGISIAGGNSSFGSEVIAGGGSAGSAGGVVIAGQGGSGGAGGGGWPSGGGGAGGYSGNGGNGSSSGSGSAGTGGGGGGGTINTPNFTAGTRGGGVGILGQGANGAGGIRFGDGSGSAGGAGSGGSGVTYGGGGAALSNEPGAGGGGGALAWKNNISVTAGSSITVTVGSAGNGYFTPGVGAVRIIWGPGRSFPSTNTADQ